ncbi:thiamine pyrophosphate-binding protein [Actinocrinis puniceicyclus]|uniref:Thiamine pyrophosphate-binding protein n=1 Tax=Actinocrinis puniceicyclus TaxID=977794 RepID=A0A8J7WQR5_9ACTN|nr:thiamine pyrophosphate-dependent enzyme [Actinocrinis puniceicyclus]MBS2964394.1 thiamine pyrophosphate-binding protein [Actinocrinis puniceicyclus]
MQANASLGAELRGSARVCDLLVDLYAQAAEADAQQPVPVFGMPAESINPIVDALRKRADLRLIGVRHEGSGSLAASAYAKLTGRIGMCMGTAGPGATHLLSGAYDARADRAPLLIAAGQVHVPALGTEAFQEIDSRRLFDDATLSSRLVLDADAAAIIGAAHARALHRRGPVHLDLPGDVLARARRGQPAAFTPHAAMTTPVLDKSLLRPAAALLSAGPAVILVGDCGAGLSEAFDALAARLGAPILLLPEGMGHLREPGEQPAFRVTGPLWEAARDLLRTAVVVAVGPLTAAMRTLMAGRPAVQIGPWFDVAEPPCAGTLRLLGHELEYLDLLAKTAEPAAQNPLLRRAQESLVEPEDPAQRAFWERLDASLPHDAVISCQPGALLDAVFRHLPLRERRVTSSFGYSARGYAVPGAIGAAFACPGRASVALTEPDGFAESMAELLTIRRYRLPVTAVCVEGATARGNGASIDFADFAAACDLPARRVGAAEDIAAITAGAAGVLCVQAGAPSRETVTARGADGSARQADARPDSFAARLVELIEAAGVTRAFRAADALTEPVAERWSAHERRVLTTTMTAESAAMMASATAKWTNAPTLCLVASGHDLVLQLNGLFDAAYDHAPVAVLTVARGEREAGLVDSGRLLAAAAAVSVRVTPNAASLAAARDALALCLQRRTVVHLEVDAADLGTPVEPPALTEAVLPAVAAVPALVPGTASIAQAAGALLAARRCAVLAGRGAGGAAEQISQLCEKLAAPIVTTMPGRGLVPDDHPAMAGAIGSSGHRSALRTLEGCDTLLILGVSNRGQAFDLPSGCKIIRVDTDPVAVSAGVDVGLCGSVRDTVELLLAGVCAAEHGSKAEARASREKFRAARREEFARFRQRPPKQPRGQRPIPPSAIARTLGVLSDQMDRRPVVTVDVGLVTLWLYRFLTGRQNFVWTSSFATMGFAMPAALAVSAVGTNGRPVVAAVGDGGIAITMAELASAAPAELPVTIVVFNNGKLGAIKYEQEIMGWPEYGSALVNGDLAAYARACGVHGVRITRYEELEPALRSALERSGPTLLDVVCDPHELPSPPKSHGTFRQSVAFSLALAREGRRRLRGASSEDPPPQLS